MSNQKEKIINTAEKLIAKKGYDNLSLNEVIKSSGVAKGTFYHYFDSKQTLFDHIFGHIMQVIMIPVKRIVDDKELDAISKFNKIIDFSASYKLKRKTFFRAFSSWVYKKENSKLRQQIMKYSRIVITPEYAKIIEQGKKEGVFKVVSPQATADMILTLAMSMAEQMAPILFEKKIDDESAKVLQSQIEAFNEAVERLLGTKPGTVTFFDKKMVEKFIS